LKQKLLTDSELRAHWSQTRSGTCCVEEGTILTPAARDFLRDHNITLTVSSGASPAVMSRTPVPTREGKAIYIDQATGRELDHKPEEMTHLHGNVLVPKTHPQIEFRGRLDSLMAQMLGVQLVAHEMGLTQVCSDVDELLGYTRSILAAEVKNEPVPQIHLMGMDSAQIRYNSHHVKEVFGIDHPVPHYSMGRMCVALNRLRTQVREVELSAARTFSENGVFRRTDIIEGLNRLSSCVYIIFCRTLSQQK